MFDTSAIRLPSGENSPVNTPWPGTEAFVWSVPCPQSAAWVENGTLLVNAMSPKFAPRLRVPSTRIVEPSGDQSTSPPRSQPGAEVQSAFRANRPIVAKHSRDEQRLRGRRERGVEVRHPRRRRGQHERRRWLRVRPDEREPPTVGFD